MMTLKVINTHCDLYQCTHLSFVVALSLAIFQKMMDTILQGIENAFCYLNDIFITGSTEIAHLANLKEVLQRLKSYCIQAKQSSRILRLCILGIRYLELKECIPQRRKSRQCLMHLNKIMLLSFVLF